MPYAVGLQSYITSDVGRMNETVRLLKTDFGSTGIEIMVYI